MIHCSVLDSAVWNHRLRLSEPTQLLDRTRCQRPVLVDTHVKGHRCSVGVAGPHEVDHIVVRVERLGDLCVPLRVNPLPEVKARPAEPLKAVVQVSTRAGVFRFTISPAQ